MLNCLIRLKSLFRIDKETKSHRNRIQKFIAYFLHFSQLYMLSPLRSSAEKNAARQSRNPMLGPQNQLKNTMLTFELITNFVFNLITNALVLPQYLFLWRLLITWSKMTGSLKLWGRAPPPDRAKKKVVF